MATLNHLNRYMVRLFFFMLFIVNKPGGVADLLIEHDSVLFLIF